MALCDCCFGNPLSQIVCFALKKTFKKISSEQTGYYDSGYNNNLLLTMHFVGPGRIPIFHTLLTSALATLTFLTIHF